MKLLMGEQVAAILGIKAQSLRLRRMRGQGPPYIRLGDGPTSRVAYPAEDLEAWLASRPRYAGTCEEKAALQKKGAA
jgi:predicted DNA-binding transcriptional regulator AlpA